MRAKAAVLLLGTLVLASPDLIAQTTQTAQRRLSDWLLDQPPSADAYPLGLSWRVPQEAPRQSTLQIDLLSNLSGNDGEVKADPASVRRLAAWVRSLPVTGRVPVAVADARWLQANPARDPMLEPDHAVVLPRRPGTVTVVTGEGERCRVVHSPGREALGYLAACSPAGAPRADWAWIAQPDGRVQRYGVSAWNREVQDEPAPGAWIWGPARDAGWPDRVSERLLRFLATQGPAPDSSERRPLSVPRAPPARSRGPVVTASDWGTVGLMQTPSARMREVGNFSFNFGRTYPYGHGNVFVQPFDWMEAGFRYSDVSNRLYNPEIAGTQSYKDKSFDVKFRLLSESASRPQLALGLRDIAGTGLFSGEYFVASKRTGPLDWSLGLGWGYVGGRGNLRNPLSLISHRFDARIADVGEGGNFSLTSYFRGPTALFGGVQYQSPWERLILKLEYDGNAYEREPQQNNQVQRSPWNVGLVYRAGRAVDVTLGVERGNTLMLGFTLHTSLDGLTMPKPNDPPRVPVVLQRPQRAPDWSVTRRDIATQTDWRVSRIGGIGEGGNELRVTVEDAETFYWSERVDRAAAVLHRDAPASVERFTLAYRQHGADVAEHVIDREQWVAQRTRPLPPSEQAEAVRARAPRRQHGEPGETTLVERPKLESGLGVNFRQTLGGPDAFILFSLAAEERAKYRIRDDTWLQGALQLRLIDNYNKFHFTAKSDLPRVRTFMREYLTTSRVTVPNLQLTHMGKFSENQFYSAYAGLLESMFAGAGGEWLYRPFGGRTAIGVDLNAVRQRDFRQDFSMRDYHVTTGHATLYWDTGWQDVQAKVSVGRYLAGDAGATLELSRVFKNGVKFGAYVTKTNVSGAQFGEGSFDKAVYVSIPFDAMLTRSSGAVGNFVWKPLTRDGGAMLSRAVTLFDVTGARDDRSLWYRPAPPPNEVSMPADRREAWRPAPAGPEPTTHLSARPGAASGGAPARVASDLAGAADAGRSISWLQPLAIGTGLTLLSSIADRRADQFAADHGPDRWAKAGINVGNALPILGLAGSALAAMDSSDPVRSRTGYAATEAGATAFLVATALKYAVGRARPEQGLGNRTFEGPTRATGYQALPSRHTAVAFAVATPFALEYNADWLYGAAALTNLARVGSREHWVSDTVGGSLIGYALGRIFWESSRARKKGEPRVMVTPSSVGLAWQTD